MVCTGVSGPLLQNRNSLSRKGSMLQTSVDTAISARDRKRCHLWVVEPGQENLLIQMQLPNVTIPQLQGDFQKGCQMQRFCCSWITSTQGMLCWMLWLEWLLQQKVMLVQIRYTSFKTCLLQQLIISRLQANGGSGFLGKLWKTG